jgi:pimeloyl-ACP methyl ester carboxylesterase
MTTFVLVHGSFHGGWCWKKAAPLLRQAGHDVYTPTLTGLGERSHLATPKTGLELHIQDILQVLEYEDLHDAVLVGHSYAGLVITAAAERAPQRVSHLIYLDAFIPHDGKSAFDLMPGTEKPWTQMAAAQGDGWLVPSMSPVEMGIDNPADAAWTQSRLKPMPLLTHQEKYHKTPGAADKLPHTYILCTEFGFHETASEAKSLGWDCFELETGHDAMITMPKELAQTLTRAVESKKKK